MSDSTRREFLSKAGMAAAAAAAVGVMGAGVAQAAPVKMLPKEEFEMFFGDMLALTSDPAQKNVSVGEVLDKYGIELDFPARIGQHLNPLLKIRPGVVKTRPGVADNGCSACCVCAICVACAEVNEGSGIVGVVGVAGM